MRRIVMLALLVGCAAPVGTVEVEAWGEDEAVEGFAADETDGWDVSFTHWYTVIGDVQLSDATSGELAGSLPGPFLIDWVEHADPVALGSFEADAGRQDVGFSVQIAGTAADGVGSATAEDLKRLEEGGWSHLVEGQASDGDRTVGFVIGLDAAVDYTLCRNGLDDTPGLAVDKDETVAMQLTLHTDHLFWDQLGTEEADLVFGPIASADADEDGVVTTEELASLSTLEAGLDPGPHDLPDVASYLAFSVSQAGHLNGGGLCQANAP